MENNNVLHLCNVRLMYANKKSANKKNENKKFTDKWVELETITQSETTQI